MLECVILAGGLGTRMRPHTDRVPKALLPVCGRPFADWQLQWLAAQGVHSVVLCVGHLGELIEAFVGDGQRWGLEVRYAREEGPLLGTAGAIRQALDLGIAGEAFFVLFGDSYLRLDLADVEVAFRQCGRPVLMTVLHNEGRWDRSNVVFEAGMVTRYDKHADPRPQEMTFVDYGLSAMTRRVVEQHVRAGESAELAPMLHSLSLRGDIAGYVVTDRFYEIGSPEGLADLEVFLTGGQSSSPGNDARLRRPTSPEGLP